ncbi:hypothetical protein MAP00_009227 [Monascus purpureus]|nr:hypothetical protein MAP00_009227 [Monascus purpureus]
MASFASTPPTQDGSNRDDPGLQGQSSYLNLRALTSTADVFKFFGGSKTVTRDGKPAKRRGPKPDSKPALTRRQQLNRQAQRSHRERKAQYIRSLETEISSLREAYFKDISSANASLQQHRHIVDSLNKENDALKRILSAHGICFEAELERLGIDRSPQYPLSSSSVSSPGYSGNVGIATTISSHSHITPATSTTSGSSPRATRPEQIDALPPGEQPFPPQTTYHSHSNEQFDYMDRDRSNPTHKGSDEPVPAVQGVFEDDPQLQVDFILTLESPCRDHTDYLCRQADDEHMPFSGHALMASCPPPSYISKTTPDQIYPHKTYDLPPANLATLLNLSRQLVADGQVTPVMALQYLKAHDMYRTLTRDDIKIIIETLNTKIRCYGFGAVIEDFELMDCLNSVLGSKMDYTASSSHAPVPDPMMYM